MGRAARGGQAAREISGTLTGSWTACLRPGRTRGCTSDRAHSGHGRQPRWLLAGQAVTIKIASVRRAGMSQPYWYRVGFSCQSASTVPASRSMNRQRKPMASDWRLPTASATGQRASLQRLAAARRIWRASSRVSVSMSVEIA